MDEQGYGGFHGVFINTHITDLYPVYMKSTVPTIATLEDYNTLRQELQASRQDTL